MPIKENQIARGVRITLDESFIVKCLGDMNLKDESVIFISDEHIFNDVRGSFVFICGGSLTTSGYAYLEDISPVYSVPNEPLY